MEYTPEKNNNVLTSSSLKNPFVMNPSITREQHNQIRDCVQKTPPPRAENAAAIRENCQHWVIRVLGRLHDEGLVTQAKVDEATIHKQPVPYQERELEQPAPAGT
jgi:hypothetical protein